MATYFRDFSDADGISDWTELPHVSGNDAPSWAIQNTDEVIATSASSHFETLAWNDIDSDGDRDDVEVVGMFKTPSFSTTNRTFSIRVSSGFPRTCYNVRILAAGIYVLRTTGSTSTSLGSDATLSLSANTWYWVRFQIIGTAYKAKVWADGDSEPGTWNVESTDSTYSTAGSVGLFKGNNTVDHVWSMFGVGTNGDTAPMSGAPTPVSITALSAISITAVSAQPRISYS